MATAKRTTKLAPVSKNRAKNKTEIANSSRFSSGRARNASLTLKDYLRSKKLNESLTKRVKQLEVELHSVERQKHVEDTVISNIAEGLMVIDNNNRVTIINNRGKEMLGYGRTESLCGKEYDKLFYLEDKKGEIIDKEDDPIQRSFATGKMVEVVFVDDLYVVGTKDRKFSVRLYVSPVKIKGEVKRVVVIFHDSSKEKRIDEIKSDFISIASHQLRTPLAVSSLHTEMLLAGHAGELTDEQKEYLDEINFYNRKMADLLNIFLSVSKIELDTLNVNLQDVDLERMVDETVRELDVPLKKKNITLIKDYARAIHHIRTDEGLLRISVYNLISNAIKYTPERGTITVSLRKEGGDILIKVSDTGCGIIEGEKSRVFTKLYRGTNVKKEGSDGTGLGLYIAKSFIERCGGQIWFDSKEDVGTTFFVSLPARSVDKAIKKRPH